MYRYFMPGNLDLEHVHVLPNTRLSDMDKAYMVINYPRTTPHPDASTWTLEYALTVSGVDAQTIEDIKNAGGDVKKIRAIFTLFQVEQRAKTKTAEAANGTVNGAVNDNVNGAMNGSLETSSCIFFEKALR
jgi:hypothetical protein